MFCLKCGEQIPDGSEFCPKCGTPLQSSVPVGAQQPTEQIMAPYGIAGFCCSILGMVVFMIPFVDLALSIIGTSLCKKSSKAIKENPAAFTGGTLVSVGHVFGIIGIVLNSFVVFATIIWGLVLGQGLFLFF